MASDKAVRRRRYGEEIKAQVMAECNGHEPHAYLKDVLERRKRPANPS